MLEQNSEKKLPGVRKSGWIKLTTIALMVTVALGMTFILLNTAFGWVEILPW